MRADAHHVVNRLSEDAAFDVSVVTVSYNVAPLLRAMLRSIFARTPDALRVEVIVVDNASHDDSAAMVAAEFPQVRLLRNSSNRGFGAGCNQGIAVARGRYVFLLNPDATLDDGALQTLTSFMDVRPDVGICGPRLLWPDGRTQSSRRRWPTFATALAESTIVQRYLPATHPLYRRFYMADLPDSEMQDVDWLVGAALFCRRETLLRVGGFDERFFMYSEELDLCRRVAACGQRIVYLPHATVTHLEGQSSKQDIPRRHIMFQTSKVQYFAKYDGPLAALALRLFLLATYVFQGAEEGAKWLLGHKRALRRERLSMVRAVLVSGLRADKARLGKSEGDEGKNQEGIAGYAPTPRIALISAEYPPQPGGVGDYSACLAQALSEQGAAVTVLTGVRDEQPVPQEAGTVRRVVPGWGWRAPGALRRALAESGAALAVIEYQTGAYDMHPAINLFPLYMRLFGGVDRPCVVATFHDTREPYLWPKAGRARRWANMVLMRFADAAIVTNREDAATAHQRYALPAARLRVVPIGSNIAAPADPASLIENTAKFRHQHDLDDAFCIGYFGLLNATKGVDTLLRTLALLRAEPDGDSYRLVIIGGQTGETDSTNRAYAATIEALIAELNLTDAVVRTGHLDETAVSTALAAQDVIALPFSDGGSLRRGSLLAALAHVRPVITTHPTETSAASRSSESCADSSEILQHGKTVWLVPPADPIALADAIRRLRAEPALRHRLAEAGQEAIAPFGWPAIARAHIELYSSLIDRITHV